MVRLALRGGDGSDACARGGDSRLAALATARHHSACSVVVTRFEEQQEDMEVETLAGLRSQTTPFPRMRPRVLKDPGPPWVAAARVGHVAAAVPCLTPVVLGQEHDDSTVAWLLARSLAVQQREGEEVREQAEQAEVEAGAQGQDFPRAASSGPCRWMAKEAPLECRKEKEVGQQF